MGRKAKKRQEKKHQAELVELLSLLSVTAPEDIAKNIPDEMKEKFVSVFSDIADKAEESSLKQAWLKEAFVRLRAIVELLKGGVEC